MNDSKRIGEGVMFLNVDSINKFTDHRSTDSPIHNINFYQKAISLSTLAFSISLRFIGGLIFLRQK